jgi:serine protease Do
MRNDNSEPSPANPLPPESGAERKIRRSNLVWIAILSVLVLGLVSLSIVPQSAHSASPSGKLALKIDKSPAPVDLAAFKNGYASVIDPALPAVVNISSTKIIKQWNNSPDWFFNDPLFRQFFGDQFHAQPRGPQTEREHSLGSGVIVNPDGYILTNNHVVEGASDIEVFTQDKKKFRAKVIGTDPHTDVAVLKIEGNGFPSLTLADSSNLKVGDIVFAVGDPFGVGETATMGIVSATGRALGGAIEHYEDFIQTDAAINPGNSGGALLDLHGDLVGINTAIITGDSGGGNLGVGFAIPINLARNVMEQIVDHGKVVRGHLGIAIQNVDSDMAKAFGLAQGGGALVADVTPGSPAAKADIQRGDIILELNGEKVNGPDDLSLHIAQTPPGTTVHLKISRNGQTRDVDVTLDELSESATASESGESGTALQGVQVQNLTPSVARELGISPTTTGVVITSVDSSSAAAVAGLQQGDVIQEVNRKPVTNVAAYNRALAAANHQAVLLLVKRGEATRYVVIEQR